MPDDKSQKLSLKDLSPDELRLVTFLFFYGPATAEEIKEHLGLDIHVAGSQDIYATGG